MAVADILYRISRLCLREFAGLKELLGVLQLKLREEWFSPHFNGDLVLDGAPMTSRGETPSCSFHMAQHSSQ